MVTVTKKQMDLPTIEVKKGTEPALPHERDESTDESTPTPRPIMQQAAIDLERGLVDTDMHGQRGVECVTKPRIKKAPERQKKKTDKA